jgi:hypothetical protein
VPDRVSRVAVVVSVVIVACLLRRYVGSPPLGTPHRCREPAECRVI